MSILFVGAPFGRFFRYLAPALEGRGITVWRTVCDGGEFIATPAANRVVYRGSPDGFRAFLRRTMIERRVTTVVTFNDMCPRARAAHAVASDLRIGRRVLEEGYLRPWWVTFDHEGVNGNTLLPKDPEFYLRAARPPVPHRTFKHTFRYLVRDTITHFAACTLMSPVLPYDPRYYGDSVWRQARGYTGQYLWRKTHRERPMLRTLRARHAVGARIFVTLLQKPGDAQLRFHSRYRANNPYMREVMASFAAHAGPDDILVVKQHPLDYGIEGSAPLFRSLVADLGLQDRAYYSRKLTIESLLDIAAGLTTVNSTGGLSAINRLLPTIALGDAIYDVPGITFQDGLDRFWAGCRPPREDLVQAFVNYLASETQINGGFYSHEALTLLIGNLTAMMTNGVVAPHKTMALRRAEAPADRTSVPTVGVPAPQAI